MTTADFQKYIGLEVMLVQFPEKYAEGQYSSAGAIHFGHVIGEYGDCVFLERSRDSYVMMANWPARPNTPRYWLFRSSCRMEDVYSLPKTTIAQVERLQTPSRQYEPRYESFEGAECRIFHSKSSSAGLSHVVEGILARDFGPFLIVEDALEKISPPNYEREYIHELCLVPGPDIRKIEVLRVGSLQFRECQEWADQRVDITSKIRIVRGGFIIAEGRDKILVRDPDNPGSEITMYKQDISNIRPTKLALAKRGDLKLVVNNGSVDMMMKANPDQEHLRELYAHLRVNPWFISPGKDVGQAVLNNAIEPRIIS